MTTTLPPRSIEPLFASREREWLRVWVVTQAAALAIGAYVTVDAAGGLGALLASPAAPRVVATFAALVAYHAVGYRASRWILRRRLAVMLFVPLGWALIVGPVSGGVGFGLLVFGAVIQGFIFLPFAWAIGILAVVVAGILASAVPHDGRPWTGLVVARVASVLATGIMIGTVMLYIHRANRDAAIRARLLGELDAAQRDLADRAREAGVQEERRRLAHDLHDTLAQGFTSVIAHLEAIELSFGAAHAAPTEKGDALDALGAADAMRRARPHLAHAQDVSRASLAEIRRLLWALRPPQLAEATLGAAIARTVAQWSASSGVEATCAIEALPPLQPDADVVFLRATQESLSNVARHAGARHVSVALHCVDGLVLLSIEDDGRGFADADGERAPGEGVSAGVGLAAMRERVRRVGGRVLVDSAAGAGASVTVAMPLAEIALVAAQPPSGARG